MQGYAVKYIESKAEERAKMKSLRPETAEAVHTHTHTHTQVICIGK